MKTYQKLGHPLFVASLLLLLVNDWALKSMFHNAVTGKLSDLAGLFALPYLLSVFVPHRAKWMHLLAALLFCWWKSPLAQGVIDAANTLGLPMVRTVDYTDLVALVAVVASYRVFTSATPYPLQPGAGRLLVLAAFVGFTATTLPPHETRKYEAINQTYAFDFSKRELVSRLNMVQMKEVYRLNKHSGQVDFNPATNVFHYHGRTDTLGMLLDYTQITDQDTVAFKTSYAEVMITGNEVSSSLTLVNVYQFVVLTRGKDYRKLAINRFEKHVVKPIRKYRKLSPYEKLQQNKLKQATGPNE